MASTPQWLHQVLEDYNTNLYHIHFGDFKSNHLAHGIVSMYDLGFDEKAIRDKASVWMKTYEPAIWDQGLTKGNYEVAALDDASLQELQGKLRGFLRLVSHYEQKLSDCNGNIDQLIQEYLPRFSDGMVAQALHPIIHLGYGYRAQDGRTVCEGIAYLHYGYVPQELTSLDEHIAKLGTGTENILDILEEVRNGDYLDFVKDKLIAFGDERDGSQFLRRTHTLLTKRGDGVARLVGRVQFPSWFDKDNLNKEQLEKIGDWITQCGILVYGVSEAKNDFFLLHGATGTWGLSQVLPLLTGKDALAAILYIMSGLIAAYVTQYCPKLNPTFLNGKPTTSWEDLIKEAGAAMKDEHIYKLIQVCHGQARSYEEQSDTFLNAAQMVLKHNYHFIHM